ncbi:MAG TPA: hypothetical protein VF255_06860 [Solirubrobacterales bacterium]
MAGLKGRLIGGAAVALVLLAAGFLLGRSSGEGEDGDDGGSVAVRSESVGFAVLSTERCATEMAIEMTPVHVEQRLTVPVAAGLEEELTAYASSPGSVLIGPRGWKCRAALGVDGTQQIGLTPPSFEKDPWFAKAGDPVVLETIIPACAGCISSMICAFFPQEEVVQVYAEYEECPEVPEGEKVSYVSRSTVTFVDPVGVKGTGLGSGGSLPSIGAVVYEGREQGARQLDCTLPGEIADLCPGIVGGTLAMGG